MRVAQLLEFYLLVFLFYFTIRANAVSVTFCKQMNNASCGAAKFEIRKEFIGSTHHVVKLCLQAIGW